MTTRSRQSGFTLIEVLAAMLLLAIALPVIMSGVTLATRTGDQARRRTEAAGLADSKLSELLATGAWDGGITNGNFGDDWPDYQWTASVQDWAQGAQSGLQELDVKVSWPGRGGEESVVLSTLVYLTGTNGNTPPSSSSSNTSSNTSSGSGSGSKGTGKSSGASGGSGASGKGGGR